MSKNNSILPKMVVPAVPYNNGIRFLMETDQIDISSEFAPIIWKIIEFANGYNTIDTIAKQTKICVDDVQTIVNDLLELGIMYDSREYYLFFHKISKSPDIYSHNLSYEKVLELQKISRQNKNGNLLDFSKNISSPLSQLIFNRRSCRNFSTNKLLNRDIISNICFHGYSITKHSVPSGGALYPITLYVIVEKTQDNLSQGYYEYDSINDGLRCYQSQVDIEQLKYCFNDIEIPFDSSVQIVIAADFSKETKKYSNRGYRLTLIEAGQVAQNIALYCEEQKLGSCELGGVLDEELSKELELKDKLPLLTIAIGIPEITSEKTSYDCLMLEDKLMSKYVGKDKPIKFCIGRYLSNNASFFAASSNFGQKEDGAGGTSTSLAMAKIKAIVEGYERYVSETPVVDCICSSKQLTCKWINPNLLNPTSLSLINLTKELSSFSEQLQISWKEGHYLLSKEPIMIPIDLIYYGEYDLGNRICYSNSSGVAGHLNETQAIKNAIIELIERDAIMRNWYERKTPKRIAKKILPIHLRKRIKKWKNKNREVLILDMNSNFVPTILAIIKSDQYPCFVCGASAGFDIETTILKAMQEAEFSLYSLLNQKPKKIDPSSVCTPIDHGLLYSTSKYLYNIEWLWTNNEIINHYPCAKYSYDEILRKLNPIVVNMSIDNTIKIVRVFSEYCLPINFGDTSSNHPIMNTLNINPKSYELPHYFA